jgi:hypothetical protein
MHHALFFGKYKQAYKLGGELAIYPITIAQGLDA